VNNVVDFDRARDHFQIPHLRVLILASDAFGGTGGIAQYMRDLVSAIASYRDTANVTVIPRVIAREIEPLPPRVTHIAGAAGTKLGFVAAVLRAAAGRPRFDWIVCGHINLLPIAHAAAAVSGARVILVTYGMEVWHSRGRLTRFLLSRTSGIISISSFTIEKMRTWAELASGRSFLIPNAIDLSRYTPGVKNEQLVSRLNLQGRHVLLTLGRMDAAEQAKGFDEILDVLPRLVSEIPDIVYVAVGDGTDRPRLEAKARALGLADRAIFPGYVTEEEKLDYYRLADVFVMPSRLEGFGYVFLEALAVGIPVIASKVDGSREAVMNGEWGLLVDPSDPEELIAAVRRALLSPTVPRPEELQFFSRSRFERRCHDALDTLRGLDHGSRP
jgi:phosphatidyl-myo-inositol dimannoside synthase